MNTNRKPFKILYLAVALFLAIAICVASQLAYGKISPQALPVYTLQTENGKTLRYASVSDITSCHILTAVNHTPNEFLDTGTADIGHASDTTASQGTYQFFIANLDPANESFEEQAQALDFLKSSNGWNLTMYLPPVRSACTVYVRMTYQTSVGMIEGYDYRFYYAGLDTPDHSERATEPIFLELLLYDNPKFLSIAPDESTRILHNGVSVTVHYESEDGMPSGLDGDILIGEDSAVRAAVARNHASSYITLICATVICAILLFVSILKQRADFVPQIVFVLGIFGTSLFSYWYMSKCGNPDLLHAFYALSLSLMTLGAALSVRKRIRRIPLGIALSILAGINCIVSFYAQYTTAETAVWLSAAETALHCILLFGIPVGIVCSVLSGTKRELCLGAVIEVVLLSTVMFGEKQFAFLSPLFVMCVALLAVTVYISFREFVLTEKSNNHLTANLQAEVHRQTENLENILSERDTLLRYVSHDLKKPVSRIDYFLSVLETSKDEAARADAIQTIRRKVQSISTDLDHIQTFAKSNYTIENSVITPISPLLSSIYEELKPDCTANGIVFKCNAPQISAFTKPERLASVIRNLIFNALDHAYCSQIVLEAHREKNACKITLSDNGKGIDGERDIFRPYATTSEDKDNLGLGLHICREHLRSMGGDLTHSRIEENTVFTITLPLV